MADYKVLIYDTSGVLKAEATDFLNLNYIKKLNRPGSAWMTLNGNHSVVSMIQDKWIVQILRKASTTWKTELTTLFRDESWAYGIEGPRFSMYCQDVNMMLWWRIVNYYSGYTNRSSFSNIEVESVVKYLVDYNLASSATIANGRKREGAFSNISVEADSATGSQIYWNCHGKQVGETLYELSRIHGFDYQLFATAPQTYEFRYYQNGLGSDISATQTFSMENGNMSEPIWKVSRAQEKTSISLWGKGEGPSRDYLDVEGPNFSSSNDIETYVRATDVDLGDTDSLEAKGDGVANEKSATTFFDFKVIQSASNKYGDDYDLGNTVSAKNPFNGTTHSNMKIAQITVSLQDSGKEDIGIEIESR